MKVRELSAIGKLLGMCGLGKMKSADKVCVVKASRAIRKAVSEYDEAAQEAVRCLKPEGFDALRDKSRSTGLSGEEAAEFGRMMRQYDSDVEAATADLGEAEAMPEFERLGEDAFFSLVDSNESLTLEQIQRLEEVLC